MEEVGWVFFNFFLLERFYISFAALVCLPCNRTGNRILVCRLNRVIYF